MIRKINTVKKLPKQIKLQMDTMKSHPGEGGGGWDFNRNKTGKPLYCLDI